MSTAMSRIDGGDRSLTAPLLAIADGVAAVMLVADLITVCVSVILRSVFSMPIEWADDVARGLMVGSSFFGMAGAIARAENFGLLIFVNRLPARTRLLVDTVGELLMVGVSSATAFNAIKLGWLTTGQTTGSGLPLELTFYPMGAGAILMTVFALDLFRRRPLGNIVAAAAIVAMLTLFYFGWKVLSPATMPTPGALMAVAFLVTLCGGLPIGFALSLTALIFIGVQGRLPSVIFAQQMARGIDNFVLLAIPFFILVGYLMEANGMSIRLIAILQRLVGRVRGGLNVVIVTAMVLFSGISGSKVADVAAVGSVLVPAARRTGQNPGSVVALLASSAVMAETIPPCINLIILGFVANLSIGGLFMAGLLPAGMMAVVLIVVCIIFGKPAQAVSEADSQQPLTGMWSGGIAALGLIFLIFFGFKSGFATATEVSAFAVVYAIAVGTAVFRELNLKAAAHAFILAAVRSGLVLFILAAASSLGFVLTLQQVPHLVGDMMISLSQTHGNWLFMVMAIAILIAMGSVLEGGAALVIFGPLLVPVAVRLGVDPLHFGVVLVISMGIGVFAPPMGLGLYSACLIGNVPIESTIKPMLGYLGVLFLCLLIIAFVPGITTILPRAFGY